MPTAILVISLITASIAASNDGIVFIQRIKAGSKHVASATAKAAKKTGHAVRTVVIGQN